MMIAAHFQAIGHAAKAAILGLSKAYCFAIPLTLLLPLWFGETGVWYAGPSAEGLLCALTGLVLWHGATRGNLRWGLFRSHSDPHGDTHLHTATHTQAHTAAGEAS